MVGIESECFVVYLSCVYVRLIMSSYLLFCLVSACRVIVEVLVLGLLVVVYKIPYSSCM